MNQPKRRKAVEHLEHLLAVNDRTVEQVSETLETLRLPQYGKYSTFTPPYSRRPTDAKSERTVEVINRFVRLGVLEWVDDASDPEIDAAPREPTETGSVIVQNLMFDARDLRQRPGVVDDLALVASEHYFVGRSIGSETLVELYDWGKPLWPAVTSKPKSPPLLWIRAWALQGARDAD